jgi:FkbM family methyltransferase
MGQIQDRFSSLVDIELFKTKHQSIFSDLIEQEYNIVAFSPDDVKGKTVIDIGAHVGTFSLLCQACEAANITCIEASPKNFAELTTNLQKCTSVRSILNIAVADGCIKTLNITDEDTASKTTTDIQSPFTGIPCISLDDIINIHDGDDLVLKIDIEGDEYKVIPSCSKRSLRKCKTIFLEIHPLQNNKNDLPGHTSRFLREYMSAMGFNVVYTTQIFWNQYDAQGNPVSSAPIPNFEMTKLVRS